MEFFTRGGSKTYMPKKVTNTQRIINKVILKIVNIVVSRGAVSPPLPHIYSPEYITPTQIPAPAVYTPGLAVYLHAA
jgi:hypothetical protein